MSTNESKTTGPYEFLWENAKVFDIPMDFSPLISKKFVLGKAELPKNTFGLVVEGFIHDMLLKEGNLIARCKLIKEEPFDAQLQIHMLKDSDAPVILRVVFFDLVLDAQNKIQIKNATYHRFDQKQFAYFRDGTLLYEFAGSKLRTTPSCPAIIFDYGAIEYTPPMIKSAPAFTSAACAHLTPTQKALYEAIHPAQNERHEYQLPVSFVEDQVKNPLRFLLDQDFKIMYNNYVSASGCQTCQKK